MYWWCIDDVLMMYWRIDDTFRRLCQDLFGKRDFLPQSHMIEWFAEHVCGKRRLSKLCGNIFFILCGFDEKNLNVVRITEIR